jgi:hypothetical protein
MNLTWNCPDCGKQLITYQVTRSTSGYLLCDGTEDKEFTDEGKWVFRCSGCKKELVDEEGNSLADDAELLNWLATQEE